MLSSILEILKGSPSIDRFVEAVKSQQRVAVGGTTGSSTSILVGILFEKVAQPLLVVCPDDAEIVREDIENIVGSESVLYFPDWEVLPYDELSPHEAIVGQRLKTLSELLLGQRRIVVAPIRALLRHIIPPEDLAESLIRLSLHQQVRFDELIGKLIEAGFTRVSVVEEVGTFSVRGGIVDVYPPSLDNPIRLELFGDEIESIR